MSKSYCCCFIIRWKMCRPRMLQDKATARLTKVCFFWKNKTFHELSIWVIVLIMHFSSKTKNWKSVQKGNIILQGIMSTAKSNIKDLVPMDSGILDGGCRSILIQWCQPLKLPATSTVSPSPQYLISTWLKSSKLIPISRSNRCY